MSCAETSTSNILCHLCNIKLNFGNTCFITKVGASRPVYLNAPEYIDKPLCNVCIGRQSIRIASNDSDSDNDNDTDTDRDSQIRFSSTFEPFNALLTELQGDCSDLDNVQRYFLLETNKKISPGCSVFNSEIHRALVTIKQMRDIHHLFDATQISVKIEIIDPKIMFVIRKMYEFYDYNVSVYENTIRISCKD